MCISSNHGKHSHNRKLLVSEKFIFCNNKSNYKKVKEKAMNFALVQDNHINKICVKVFPKHTIAFYPQSSKKKTEGTKLSIANLWCGALLFIKPGVTNLFETESYFTVTESYEGLPV